MSKSWKLTALVVVLCVGMLTTSCYGPFNLTRKLHHWNGTIDGKWGNEGVFLLVAIIPVYGICMLGDALIFNSIEFWGGTNPISAPMVDAGNPGVGQVAIAQDR
jgi:hypothetical protein